MVEGATRRNTEFLMSVKTDQLTGAGVALTLTVRDCPPTADDWHRLRRAWEKRMVRAGMLRLHWVTEWQRREFPTSTAPSGGLTLIGDLRLSRHGWRWQPRMAQACAASIGG